MQFNIIRKMSIIVYGKVEISIWVEFEEFTFAIKRSINKDNMLVKQAYHILRIRANVDNYIQSGKYTLTLSEDWIKCINELKTNWDKTSDTSYLVTLKQYLQEIKDIRNGVFQNE